MLVSLLLSSAHDHRFAWGPTERNSMGNTPFTREDWCQRPRQIPACQCTLADPKHLIGVCKILWSIFILKTRIERDTCTPVFIAALFIIARTWKQPRRPSADEWIRKLWSIYTMEYYSDIKKNTFESVLMRWMKLELIIQSEVSQEEKHQYSILTHIYGI